MSVGSTTQRKQAVMVIGVDGKPSNEALKKIDEIPAVEEFVFLVLPRNHITPWIKEIAVKFSCLKELQIRGLVVDEEDLETLATSRGKDLRVLKINKYCRGSWEEGLVHVAKYCNQLRTLSLEGCGLWEDGKWLHELAIHSSVLESFHCRFKYGRYDVQDLTILARKCSKSLVSLKIHPCSLSLLGDTFRHALRLEDFSGACYRKGEDYSGLKLPPNMRCFGSYDLHATGLKSLLLPLANQLKELNLQCLNTLWNCCCFLVKKCPNLEVLYTEDGCGDMGMQVIGLFCKKLRKFTHAGCVTHMGLIALALGCHNLEYINVSSLRNISNEAMECIGTNLKNLRHFSVKKFRTDIPLENGIRAMLTGCNKLERLDISFRLGGLTDVGLGYIGKYGHNLKYLSLECLEGLTDAGLVEFSKGCPQLRTLRLNDCPFSEQAVSTFLFNMHSLRMFHIQQIDSRNISCQVTLEQEINGTRVLIQNGSWLHGDIASHGSQDVQTTNLK
ncbi:leucine-rich repeat, cysteine-containing subtype protein [Tanacetum coccineum]